MGFDGVDLKYDIPIFACSHLAVCRERELASRGAELSWRPSRIGGGVKSVDDEQYIELRAALIARRDREGYE